MMKLWALIGFFTAVTVSGAAAAVETSPCQPARQDAVAERIAPSVRTVDGERNPGGGLTAVRESETERAVVRESHETVVVEAARRPEPRKRDDHQVPDAMLIGRGGTL